MINEILQWIALAWLIRRAWKTWRTQQKLQALVLLMGTMTKGEEDK